MGNTKHRKSPIVGRITETSKNRKSLHLKVITSDAEAISAQIKAVAKDDELMKEILIESGIYNSKLKLTKHYK